MNPGSPAPQAGILNQARRRPRQDTQKIVNTLISLQRKGLSQQTIKDVSYKLRQISKTTDLNNPTAVIDFIVNHGVTNATKTTLAKAYQYYAQENGISWRRPKFRWERKIPLIPTTQNIDKITSATTRKYATIFTILKETGLEGHELATVTRKDIDIHEGIINAQGCKGHNSRSLKLNPQTADMLRLYLERYTGEKPFPNAKAMGEAWRTARDRLSEKLNDPQFKAIPLRNLRHYHATMLYDKTKDILLVKAKLGHKKIETTMFYTQLITFNENEEYTCRRVSTLEEGAKLIELGFQYVTDMEGVKLFRKRK